MYVYQLIFAGLRIQVQSEWPIDLNPQFLPFRWADNLPAQEHITLTSAPNLPVSPDSMLWNHLTAETVLPDGKICVLHRMTEQLPPYMAELYSEDVSDRTYCFLEQDHNLPADMLRALRFISIENTLLRNQIYMLHSSFIRWNGKGILFSAPSGTGKSTQASLWKQYLGADILNGDRAGLRKIDGVWTAYGLPFAGSSGIYRNESAPVSAIVLLEQGTRNTLSKPAPSKALIRLFPEMTLHRWDRSFLETGLDAISDLISSVPVLGLSCLPDQSAVLLLRDFILQEVSS